MFKKIIEIAVQFYGRESLKFSKKTLLKNTEEFMKANYDLDKGI